MKTSIMKEPIHRKAKKNELIVHRRIVANKAFMAQVRIANECAKASAKPRNQLVELQTDLAKKLGIKPNVISQIVRARAVERAASASAFNRFVTKFQPALQGTILKVSPSNDLAPLNRT